MKASRLKYIKLIISCLLLIITNYNVIFSNDKPIVILVSLDGFRWDYIDRGFSPHLESIANNGVRAKMLKPQFPSMTFPNHYSIITGLYPEHHGIISNYIYNPFNDSIFTLKPPKVNESLWYRGEAFWETLKRNGFISASYFWPGSEMDLPYRQPNYFESYEHNRQYEKRVNGVLNWLALPENKRPSFITLYFDETDSKAHRYGTDSDSLNSGIKRVDDMVALLDKGLKEMNLLDKVNLIILSDHGMTNISENRIIFIDQILKSDTNNVKFVNHSSLGWLFVKDKSKVKSIYEKLKSNEIGYKVYLKNEIPDRFNYKSHPFIGDIFLLPDLGWHLRYNSKWDSTYVATHGYDNETLDMHGILIARGPAFKKNYKVGVLNNIDIYPLLCKIFEIGHGSKIDGDLNRIIHILNE